MTSVQRWSLQFRMLNINKKKERLNCAKFGTRVHANFICDGQL